ncbi:MAG: MtrB/PioB family outer membrane beta-barrel protein [Gemmatimonadetes bacterium]|nr:MtrB/PioB family outer membrane beta-barrel protein [Gemmatimonadota bacterium]
MSRLLALLSLLSAAPAATHAQGVPAVQTSGRISTGLLQLDNSTNSSKLTEYRDLRNNFYLFDFRLDVLNTQGTFLDLTGTNVSRRDQNLRLAVGDVGVWRFAVAWNEIPHDLSNKAQSPYIERAPGLFEVPQPMVIPFKKLATSAPDAPRVLASDSVVAAYARSFVGPIDLANQTKTGTFAFRYDGLEAIDLTVDYTRRTKTGSRLSYGPIGDRPPRTLNIELAEPVDYRTGDLRMAAEYHGGAYQARVEYLFSDFVNEVDELLWQNVYATPAAGADYDVWDRLISAFGQRALPPDNRYHNATISGGANLPLESRLTASVSYGRLEQNEPLFPYSDHTGALANPTLPRLTADARMNTIHFSAEYSMVPVPRIHLRAFFRRFDLDNETPASQWQYVTSDASNLNGTVSYKNKRISVPFAWDRQNAGIDATWRLGFWNSSMGLGLEREDIGREYREAETAENIVRASWRARPTGWLSLRAKYLLGDRDGGTYNSQVTRQSYWYAPADAGTDADNPQFTFSNHPDMRRSDVSDRRRDQVDLTASVTPGAAFSLSTTLKFRRDDFDSHVRPSQPLLGTSLPDREAATPGDQLGLLRYERRQVSIDLFHAPAERISLNAFVGWDAGEATQRSLEFNENNKQNPSAVATAELGPWTRAGSQWTADIDDRTRYAGVGGTFGIVPSRLSLSANYTLSLSRIDIEYAGFGVTNWNGVPFPPNHQFAFQTPPAVRHDSHVADFRLEFPVLSGITMLVGYTYDFYRIRDWQQDAEAPWFERVGSEFLLRDTSRSHQWGNRLFNMGRYLAPGYAAHVGYASFTYRF